MLRQLLNMVMERKTVSNSELAHELCIDQTLIKQMLTELESQDYLQPLTRRYLTRYKRYPLHISCLFDNQPQLFVLTERDKIGLSNRFIFLKAKPCFNKTNRKAIDGNADPESFIEKREADAN